MDLICLVFLIRCFGKGRDFLQVICSFFPKAAFFTVSAVFSGGRDWFVPVFRTLNLIVLRLLLCRAIQYPFLLPVQWTAQYLSFPCGLWNECFLSQTSSTPALEEAVRQSMCGLLKFSTDTYWPSLPFPQGFPCSVWRLPSWAWVYRLMVVWLCPCPLSVQPFHLPTEL